MSLTQWPGNGILAIENSRPTCARRCFARATAATVRSYVNVHAGDTLAMGRATINVGLRFDHQWGSALPSTIEAKPGVPGAGTGADVSAATRRRSPGTTCRRARASPTRSTRAGIPFARAAYSRYAGQLSPTTIGGLNPSSVAGSATYRWVDLNGDHFAQANEVLIRSGLADVTAVGAGD